MLTTLDRSIGSTTGTSKHYFHTSRTCSSLLPRSLLQCQRQRWENASPRAAAQCRGTVDQEELEDSRSEALVSRREALRTALIAGMVPAVCRPACAADSKEIVRTDAEWRAMLPPAAYRVLRQAGTELPFSSPLYKEKRPGIFRCGGCGSPLFSSQAKFDSGTGWPSFYEPISGSVAEQPDYSIPFYPRTEVQCSKCGGHIGHVFNDGPRPTGLRYCMNGAALTFEAKS